MNPVRQLGRPVLRAVVAACAAYSLTAAAHAGQTAPPEATFTVAAKAGGKEGYCRSYAKRAVNAQKANQRNGCNLRGARWQSNFDNHYNWCVRVPRARAEAESRARQRQLQDCKQGSTRRGNEGYCNAYAKRAVNAQKQNQRNNCGFRGARWNPSFDRHYNWCLRVARRHAESESRARQRQLQSCR